MKTQVSLAELIEQAPLEQGLEELVAYFGLATEYANSLIDDGNKQTVSWIDTGSGTKRQATFPLVVYGRGDAPVERG